MYAQWQEDATKARENFRVIAQFQDGKASGPRNEYAAEFTDDWMVRHVEAEAKTGSRYVVVATRLGVGGAREGGPVLITVLWPWQDAWTLAEGGYLDESYVAEHLTDGRYAGRRLNAGDLVALTMAIRHVLGREENE